MKEPSVVKAVNTVLSSAPLLSKMESHAVRRQWKEYVPEPPKEMKYSPLFTQFHKWDGQKKYLSDSCSSKRKYDFSSNLFSRMLSAPLRQEKIMHNLIFPKSILLRFSIGKDSNGDLWLIPNVKDEYLGTGSAFTANNSKHFRSNIKKKYAYMPLQYLTSNVTVTNLDKINWNPRNDLLVNSLYIEEFSKQLIGIRGAVENQKYHYQAEKASLNHYFKHLSPLPGSIPTDVLGFSDHEFSELSGFFAAYIEDELASFPDDYLDITNEVGTISLDSSIEPELAEQLKSDVESLGQDVLDILPDTGSVHDVIINFKEGSYEHVLELDDSKVFHINMFKLKVEGPDYEKFLETIKPILFEDEKIVLSLSTKKIRKFLEMYIKFVHYNMSQ